MPTKVSPNGIAYLGVYFSTEDSKEEALTKAIEIVDALMNREEEQLLEEPMGLMEEYTEDFRCMIPDSVDAY